MTAAEVPGAAVERPGAAADVTVPGPSLPPGRTVYLPGRGHTFIRELAGPPGAPVLLLLHGWTVTADLNWFTSYEPLSQHFRVLALDHRGHGQGIRSRKPFRLEDCADDAAALAEVLGIDRLIPVGYSMGGPVAQLMWRRHRGLVAGLVLCATGRSFSGLDLGSRIYFSSLLGLSVAARVTPAPVRRELTGRVIRRRLAGGQWAEWALAEMQRNDTSTILQAGWTIGRFRSHDWIGHVDVPTAVVVTAHDRVVHPDRQLRLAGAIPEARLITVEGDHSSCVTDPDLFVPGLIEACKGVAARAGLLGVH
ncbi:MAG TPA: alpha/beta fold hydrolase [Acidimicrobiales bacterium]|nr:alpha/beta fold hydrolase [Acidimicrobiales bacterium]